MTDEDIRKLLGGYATHTLSEGEEKALFEAALHDDQLFAALADEQALREMLDDPGNRAAMLRALQPAPRRVFRWMAPVWAAAGLVVIATVTFVFQHQKGSVPVEMAKVIQPALQPEVRLERPAESAPRTAPESNSASRVDAVPAYDRMAPKPAGPALLRDRQAVKEEVKAPEPQLELKAKRAAAPIPPPAAPSPAQAAPMVAGGAAPVGAVAGSNQAVTVQADAPILQTATFAASGNNGAGRIQYSISKRAADGEFKPVDANTVLQPADTVQLTVQADETGYLAVSQKETRKMLYQGIIQSQMPVIVPLTGNLEVYSHGPLQILYRSPGLAGGNKNGFLAGRQLTPGSMPARKSVSESDLRKTQAAQQSVSTKDQAMQQQDGAAAGTITLDVNLNVASPAQQTPQKK